MSEVKEKLEEYIKQGQILYERAKLYNDTKNSPFNALKGIDSYEDIEKIYIEWVNSVWIFLDRTYPEHKIHFGRTSYGFHNLNNLIGAILKKNSVLKGIKENLPFFEKNTSPQKQPNKNPINSNKIFIVHGRDETAKLSVENFLIALGLEPIILHKQANEGKTIIEKIEAHSDVGFAVVLLTPDDQGRLKGTERLEDRARQNVIFELGYFMGKLDRKYVCGLCKEGFELPSDYHGITYIPMDKHDGWHNKLAKELKAAGIEFNEKKLLEV